MTRDELVLEKIASVIAEASYMEEMEKVALTYDQERYLGRQINQNLDKVFGRKFMNEAREQLHDRAVREAGKAYGRRMKLNRMKKMKPVETVAKTKPINRILSRAKGLGVKAEKYISRVPKKYRALATVGIGGAAGFGGYEALKNRGNE